MDDGAEADKDAGEEADEGAGAQDVQAELAEMRKCTRNSHLLTAKILGQSELQIQARMLCDVFEPTFTAYCQELEIQKTQAGCALHEASKATGGALAECRRIASLLHDEKLLDRYDITRSGLLGAGVGAAEAAEAAFHVEQCRADALKTLVLSMVSVRCWSESYHAETLPDMFASAMHSDPAVAKSTFEKVRRLWAAVEAAEAYEGEGKASLTKLLNVLGFHKHQLVRELIATCQLAGWDPGHVQVQSMVARTFAVTGNTTFVNEDIFNLLRDQERLKKGRAAARYASWWAAGNAEVLKLTDMPSVQPLAEDWSCQSLPTHLGSDGVFFPGSHKPDARLRLRDLQKGQNSWLKWRKAGSSSNAAALAASVALRLMRNDDGEFKMEGKVWAGCLARAVGTGLLEKSTGNFYVSLGFEEYVFCAWLLEKVAAPAGQGRDSDDAEKTFFKLSESIAMPQFFMSCEVEDELCSFSGVPLAVCVPGKQPGGGLHCGILLQQAGPPEPLLKLVLRQSPLSFLASELKLICQTLKVAPQKGANKKSDFLRCVMLKSGFSEEEVEALLGEPEERPDDILKDAFEIMDAETADEFRALRAEDDLNRARQHVRSASGNAAPAGPRLAAQYVTPPELKELVPGGGLIPGVALYKNPIKQSFLACYGGETRRRTWGFTTGRTAEDAQQLCVEWMWKMHGGQPAADAQPAAHAEVADHGAQRGRGRNAGGARGGRRGRGQGRGRGRGQAAQIA